MATRTATPTREPLSFFERPEDLPQLRPGRHGLDRKVVERTQRERLLAGILQAVGEEGYVPTTVADVIKRAGVSRKTFYEHFNDKEDCYAAALDVVIGKVGRAVGDVFSAEKSWRVGVRASLQLLVQTILQDPGLGRAVLVEPLAAGPAGHERIDRMVAVFAAALDRGRRESGLGRRMPQDVSEGVVGACHRVVQARLIRGTAADKPAMLPTLVYLALAPYIGPEDAAAEAANARR
jgi:AcrR family transcriptional regulator